MVVCQNDAVMTRAWESTFEMLCEHFVVGGHSQPGMDTLLQVFSNSFDIWVKTHQ